MCTCVHDVCIQIQIQIQIQIHIHIHIYICMYVCMYVCMYIYIYVYIYICVCVCMHVYLREIITYLFFVSVLHQYLYDRFGKIVVLRCDWVGLQIDGQGQQDNCNFGCFDESHFVKRRNGLEYNQQQKFMLAWPKGVNVMLLGRVPIHHHQIWCGDLLRSEVLLFLIMYARSWKYVRKCSSKCPSD